MTSFEYRVVPAPAKGLKAKGIKTPEARFSYALEDLMNRMGAAGWEYQRAETLPSLERSGLASTTTEWRNVLVFRRERAVQALPDEPALLAAPEAQQDATEPEGESVQEDDTSDLSTRSDPSQSAGASRMLRDNGVEEASDVSGVTSSLKQLVASRSFRKPGD
ncbi:DUF4177 domain-containing protein [Sulfitobacter sp. D35]|uniref:DUF4177 domain-containing protein n=1 Tax=Sulfitobacter sp. D35 TaxID=3083252 RepID=UPI00296ECFF1|nr:DUF4177 domain-containing protein [Sulfitobacter sp. D35]MDW4497474.1 DUF4177 domain-containing protein [Sulfitobacter sp. D35]